MQSNYPVAMVSGVPVVTTPDDIDAGNAEGLRVFAITGVDRVIPNFRAVQEAVTSAPVIVPDGEF